MLHGEVSDFSTFARGPARVYIISTLFYVLINNNLKVVEAVRQGVKVGEEDFVG